MAEGKHRQCCLWTDHPRWVRVARPLHSIQRRLYYSPVAVTNGLAIDTLRRIGRALADPTRQRILLELVDGSGYPAELADAFGVTRANLSNHLTCLRGCGLVIATAEGRRIRYELADPRLADALRLLGTVELNDCEF